MRIIEVLSGALVLVFAAVAPGAAEIGDGGTKVEAEQAIQAYLTLWSRADGVSAASVARFYAPRVVYYGKVMSREAVLADKRAYARAWPIRHYAEVPGTIAAKCNAARSLCKVSADMVWHRIARASQESRGRARLSFDFVPVDGGRKIARESARLY